MTLGAIILRLEGVILPTGEIFHSAANEVLEDAGFDHKINRDSFAQEFGSYVCKDRFLSYAAQFLRRRRQSEDLQTLLEVVYRRIVVSAERSLLTNPPALCDGVRELVSACSSAGLQCGVVTSINIDVARQLMSSALGDVPVFAPSGMKNDWTGTAVERAQNALMCALKGLQQAPANCLALQSSSFGLAAAEYTGIPAVAVIGASALNGGLYGARSIVDDLPQLAARRLADGEKASGATLLQVLKELHAKGRPLRTGSNAMQVHHILKDKGADIKSVHPSDCVDFVAKRLAEEKVGALVVLSPAGALEGIVSERDIVRGLASHGCELLAMSVSNIMTRSVITCSPADSIYGVAKVMTNRRIRHVPVSERGQLVGLISIGDVLSRRLEEVQLEVDVLRDYTIALK